MDPLTMFSCPFRHDTTLQQHRLLSITANVTSWGAARTSQNAHKAKFREFPSTQSAEYTSVGGGFQCGASGGCLVVPPSQPNAFTHEPSKRSARIRLLNESAMLRTPESSSKNRPQGWLSATLVAGPFSRLNIHSPVPATVVILPFRSTLRTLLLWWQAMNRFPSSSRAMPIGRFRAALGAGPPSPEKPNRPVPATVVIVPEGSIFRTLVKSPTYRFPRSSKVIWSGSLSWAEVAGPPSPECRASPVPAKVVMIPSLSTLRIR